MIVFWILLALVALRWMLLLLGAALIIRPVSDCPACFRPTFLLRTPWLRRLAPWLEWRWCPRCRWQGLSRVADGAGAPARRRRGTRTGPRRFSTAERAERVED